MEHFLNPNLYAVLYSVDYGGFKISEEGCKMILDEFPDKRVVLFGEGYDEFEYGSRSRGLREDQSIIRFMVDKGVSKFTDTYSKLGITFLPIYENIKIPFLIEDYDGRESIRLAIPYKEIVKDLADNTSKNELTKYIRERGFDAVVNVISSRLHRYQPK